MLFAPPSFSPSVPQKTLSAFHGICRKSTTVSSPGSRKRKMAISFGSFTSLLATETPSLAKSVSASPFVPARANLRAVRLVTFATMSKPATETKKREPRGIMKPRPVSPEMQALVGESEIPRTQALKKIWAYIKQHNLQDPENKKVIICDEKLKKVLGGKDRVGFLEIAGLISPHFLK